MESEIKEKWVKKLYENTKIKANLLIWILLTETPKNREGQNKRLENIETFNHLAKSRRFPKFNFDSYCIYFIHVIGYLN